MSTYKLSLVSRNAMAFQAYGMGKQKQDGTPTPGTTTLRDNFHIADKKFVVVPTRNIKTMLAANSETSVCAADYYHEKHPIGNLPLFKDKLWNNLKIVPDGHAEIYKNMPMLEGGKLSTQDTTSFVFFREDGGQLVECPPTVEANCNLTDTAKQKWRIGNGYNSNTGKNVGKLFKPFALFVAPWRIDLTIEDTEFNAITVKELFVLGGKNCGLGQKRKFHFGRFDVIWH